MGWVSLNDPNIKEIMGDDSWDAAGNFVDLMIDIYEKNFDRPPTRYEIEENINFVYEATIAKRYEDTPPYP